MARGVGLRTIRICTRQLYERGAPAKHQRTRYLRFTRHAVAYVAGAVPAGIGIVPRTEPHKNHMTVAARWMLPSNTVAVRVIAAGSAPAALKPAEHTRDGVVSLVKAWAEAAFPGAICLGRNAGNDVMVLD